MEHSPPTSKEDIEAICLNVFPLFVKPSSAKDGDTSFSNYLTIYLEFLASALVKQLPGIDLGYVTSLENSLKNTSKIHEANTFVHVVSQTRAALDSLSEGFFILHFHHHSCDIVVLPDKDSSNHLLFVPMELRRTRFSSAEPVEENGHTRAWLIDLPKAIFRVKKSSITEPWLNTMADLMLNEFPGAYPPGSGSRAANLPDNRKKPTPTYIIEWLLPNLSKDTIPVPEYLRSAKTISSLKNFAGSGVPWRRSASWNSLRFAVALAQRWHGFPLEQYKVLQLGFKTWLALRYHHLPASDVLAMKKRAEMLQQIALRCRKLLALNKDLDNVIAFVHSQCADMQSKIDDFLPSILRGKEQQNRVPDKVDVHNVSGRFALPESVVESLKKGPSVNMSFLKENVEPLVSPTEFIDTLNVDTALDLLRATTEELKRSQNTMRLQKPDLAEFTASSMLHGAEDFIHRLFECIREQHIDEDLLDQWATSIQDLSASYVSLIPLVKRTSPERRSREVLTLWCLTAVVDHVAREKWPHLFVNVGMVLPIDLLEGLTFRQRSLMEIAAKLISYKTSVGNNPGLFDYTSPPATQHFAVNYFDSAMGKEMQQCLQAERAKEVVKTNDRVQKLVAAKKEYDANIAKPCTCPLQKWGNCSTCRKIESLKATPTQVVHPLPRDERIAKEIIFFASTPTIIRSYAAVVHQAYTVHTAKLQRTDCMDCVAWSLLYGLALPRSEATMLLRSTCKPLETNSHFRGFSSFAVDVVYPTFRTFVAFGGEDFSGFQYDISTYQYQLNGALSKLPWMADARHTENMVLAAQHDMPVSMMKSEFILFGRVRAAPNLQIRELIMALNSMSDKQLNNDDFLTLAQRTLYEMGPTSPEAPCKWGWRADLFDDYWLSELHRCLSEKLFQIRQNWESHATMRLIIEISTFAAQFGRHNDFSQLLREAQETLCDWMNEVEDLVEEFSTQPDLVIKWRLLLVRLYSYLLLGSLEVTNLELKHRSELSILRSICGSNATEDIYHLLTLVNSHTFSHLVDIHKLLAIDSSVLSELVDATGEDSNWTRGEREDGKLMDWYNRGPYSVNPISGLILRDGFTVSELPSVIVQSPLYQEVMKNANFIVQRVNNEYASKDGRFKFGFWTHQQQYPFIQEVRDGKEFTLLPRNFLGNSCLPRQLVNQMAHWVDIKNGTIEFRPTDYRRTEFGYWMKLDSGECYINDVKKSQVLNTHDDNLKELIGVLTKIDEADNILCSKSVPDEIKVSYLQYNLTFTVQANGDVVSDNYPGYKLATLQSVPTFPLFDKYLLIQPQSQFSTKLPLVLIPSAGQIYPYEFDEVQERLIPATTLACLILALIYAKHSCTIDPLTNITGHQQALILLQQCWQNSPYSSQEFSVLCLLMDLAEDSPLVYSIKLLGYYLIRTSQHLSFLHPSQKPNAIPPSLLEEVPIWMKKYFKRRKLLPASSTLAESIENELLSDFEPAPAGAKYIGKYFARVPQIFFSKETLPAQYTNIGEFFREDTKVSPLYGRVPTEWLNLVHQATNEEMFFWFLNQMNVLSREDILTRLTFLMHNTLLKSTQGLELLQVLYCTLTSQHFPRPDSCLLNVNSVSTKQTISGYEIASLASSDDNNYKQRFWEVYAAHYLDQNYIPTKHFTNCSNYFSQYQIWYYNTPALQALHDSRYRGRLLLAYSTELNKLHAINNATVVNLTESSSFTSPQTLNYRWPVVALGLPQFELDSLNANCNGFEFFEAKLVELCGSINLPTTPLINIIALRKECAETFEQLKSCMNDPIRYEDILTPLTAKYTEMKKQIKDYEDAQPATEFPLQIHTIEDSEELQSKIVNELNDSYQKHKQSQQSTPDIKTDLASYQSLKAEVDQKRNEVWSEIARTLTSVDLPLLKLWQTSNLLMKPHPRIIPTLLKMVEDGCRAINPCINDMERLNKLAMHFAILHVHSIKLARIIELLDDLRTVSDESDREGYRSQVFAELSDKREWDPRQHPEWLIFEMERRVCIRSIQVEIASKMLNEKNIVLQLNMGEGKSKVIVPILCSILANGRTLIRVNVLASLFHEVHSYLKLALGNMLGKRIYLFPFRRNVALSQGALEALRDQFEECRVHGGIILSTPEHRLSLQLKYREVLWQYNHIEHHSLTAEDFKGIIDKPILELLDESDEILRHKYQLIYTLGDQQSIEGGSSRWHVHLALVRCIFMANLYRSNKDAVPAEFLDNEQKGSERLEKLYNVMSTSTTQFIFLPQSNESHVLPVVRLINEDFFKSFREVLFSVFQLDPEWRKIAKGRSPEEIEQIEDFVMNNYPDTPDGDKQCDAFKNKLIHDRSLKVPILVLRGLLSFEVLKTSLMRRHRIHYGIDKSRKVPMAVPFRGKDTPAEGVEFGQPDMAITLTILAHSSGIDLAAVKACFLYLKTKGINEQKEIYQRWYKISKPIMNEKFVDLLQKIEAVNVENVNLMQHLLLYFGRNYEVIAYYLDNFVLPLGTRTFPEKIIANSWDLAKSSEKVVGFSGTDDTKHTLPKYVKQIALPSVESTNGKMIDVLTKFNNRQYRSLPKELESERILQEMCNDDTWNVLIDSGALIEGMSNREVVMKVLEICPRFQTGIFFDESNMLALIDRHGHSAQLNSSRPLELTCFTYLDDIHTRGTDLPFPTKSHAFVTVATGITKDKLMQACMRMRKLVHGLHKVTFWGTSEVTMKILQVPRKQVLAETDITSVQILEWVVENTIKAQEEAIIAYASQGFHHYAAATALNLLHNNPLITPPQVIKAIVQREILATEDMYGIPLRTVNMKDHINQHGTRTKGELLGREIGQSYQLTEVARPLYDDLIFHACKLVPTGKVVRVCGSVNEEYERELQQEVEEERQRELPPRTTPVNETKWAYDQVNKPNFISDTLNSVSQALPKLLPLRQLFRATILDVDWTENKGFERADAINTIYVTKNFGLSTVQSNALSDYIRPIDIVVKIKADKTFYLLVSLFEANELVKHIGPVNTHVEFHHLQYMHGTNNDEHRCITLLKLLNGCLTFTAQEKTMLMILLSVVPDRMNFIDQAIIGQQLSPEMWQQTWNALSKSSMIDKHNGFVEERDEVVPPSGPHNVSLIKLIALLNQVRLFSSKPAKFIHELLTLRDTIRDYNYSDLHSLFGNL